MAIINEVAVIRSSGRVCWTAVPGNCAPAVDDSAVGAKLVSLWFSYCFLVRNVSGAHRTGHVVVCWFCLFVFVPTRGKQVSGLKMDWSS